MEDVWPTVVIAVLGMEDWQKCCHLKNLSLFKEIIKDHIEEEDFREQILWH